MIDLGEALLRPLESKDIESLYSFRNDWGVIQHLGGFSAGYSRSDLEDWIKRHSNRTDEIMWAIADRNDRCIGHVGLYKIDNRVRKAEFAIVIGDREWWGKGLGKKATEAVVNWGFSQLNLHKVSLDVLANNDRAIHLYEGLGFCKEGVLHDDQFRNGKYLDVVLMAVYEKEWRARHQANPA